MDCGGNLSEFCDFFDLEIESDNITINGWIMEAMDKIPACGDRFTFENLEITVTETDFRRVSTIEVVRHEREDEDEEDTKRSKRDRDRDDRSEDEDDEDTSSKRKSKERASL